MREKFTLLFLFFLTTVGYAQQDSQFTQYMYNTINVNPAYAGSREAMSVFVLHRAQWVGLGGAPVTNTASIHTPINGSDVGLGVSIVNDKIGPSDENSISADFSYTIPTSDDFKLSFGLKATANLLNIDFSKLNQYDLNDYQFETNIDNRFSPNIGAGVYLHSENSYIGLSVPNFLETKHFDRYAAKGANSHVAVENMHLYLIAGHVFDLSYDVRFKPSVLAKMVQGAPVQLDLSGNFLFNEKFMAGLSYRWSAALSGLVGFYASDSWFIGYSYDMETTRLENYNSGSHEIFLRFELFNRYTRMACPRFF
ncbi:type IX secretion system membrane protein PorP/SprF [Flavobacterium sp. W1B]|uniref:PorP/SprF family type IX secretion system membrane protein n=1 Tax=Flavobacterium sp. W1B TaxID=3394146 RepID=UPI0039BD186A